MRSSIVICCLLLAACDDSNNCEGMAKAKKAWLNYPVRTREELRAEIKDLIQENACSGITADSLRKVLIDMETILR